MAVPVVHRCWVLARVEDAVKRQGLAKVCHPAVEANAYHLLQANRRQYCLAASGLSTCLGCKEGVRTPLPNAL
jgi:hypothetical protein